MQITRKASDNRIENACMLAMRSRSLCQAHQPDQDAEEENKKEKELAQKHWGYSVLVC